MENKIFYEFHNSWILESEWADYEKYKNLFDSNKSNTVTPGLSTTVDGYQIGQELSDLTELTDDITKEVNNILNIKKYSYIISQPLNAWSIEYYINGWKGIHNHNKGLTGVTAVLYFSETLQKGNNEGSFYAFCYNDVGDVEVKYWTPYPGLLLVMDSKVWHGAYPTLNTRKVLVIDFITDYL